MTSPTDRLAAAQAAAESVDVLTRDPIPGMDLHIDGDYCAYYYAGNSETSLPIAKANMLEAIRNVAVVAGAAGRKVVHITSGGSHKAHRYEIATVKPYQVHRGGSEKPVNWEGMRLWLQSRKIAPDIHVKVWDDREADDGVAWAAKYSWQGGHKPALFYRDKDFRMIPGRHIHWTTWDVYDTDPHTFKLDSGESDTNGPIIFGQYAFWKQMLQGDSADAIPGLEKLVLPGQKPKGCGEVGARNMLALCTDSRECFLVVRDLYERCYALAWADRFVEQAALLWLRTDAKADVGDFMRAIPLADADITAAVVRLKRRIA